MPFVPQTPEPPSGGSSISKRLKQAKKELDAKKGKGTAVAEAAAGESTGPQPGQAYTLQKGDTLESVAQRVHQQPDAIWNDDENEELREQRSAPGKLQAGDTIFIPEEHTGTGPVGKGDYVVKDGDSIESIAFDTGHFWETIWNHHDNAELKEIRKNRNVLLPGDRVTLPEKTAKEEPGETEMRHRFIRKGVPAFFAFQVFQNREPRGNQEYTLTVDDVVFTGVTDAQGKLKHPIPPSATTGMLIIGPNRDEFPLRFGKLDPITEITGIQQRLNNLGFPCGPPRGRLDDNTRAAIRAFQKRMNLPLTGEPDSATVDRLHEVHDEPQQYPTEQPTVDGPGRPEPATPSGPLSHVRTRGAPGSYPRAPTED